MNQSTTNESICIVPGHLTGYLMACKLHGKPLEYLVMAIHAQEASELLMMHFPEAKDAVVLTLYTNVINRQNTLNEPGNNTR